MATSLPALPSIAQSSDPFYSTDSSNPESAFYTPPVGTYQSNTGAVVPNTTLSSTFPTAPTLVSPSTASSAATASSSPGIVATAKHAISSNLENIIFILLGLMLIAAGIFSFKSTQTIISTTGKYAAKAGEVAAA
jgi:hypothetical protein